MNFFVSRHFENVRSISFHKKKPRVKTRGFSFNLALPTFPGRLQPSIIGAADLTAVFGMGTGISPQLYAPEIFVTNHPSIRFASRNTPVFV